MRTFFAFLGSILGSAAFQLTVALYPTKLQPYAWLVKWIWIACALFWAIWLITHPWILRRLGLNQRPQQSPSEQVQTSSEAVGVRSNPVQISSPQQIASPTITQNANPSQKVEIHNHPVSPPPVPVKTEPERVRHNVLFLGAKKIWTDIEHEVFGSDEGFPALRACFLNKPIPGAKIGDFDYARARIVFRDASDTEVAAVSKPKWLNHGTKDVVHIEGNTTECLLLAICGNGDEWAAPYIAKRPAGYWEDGEEALMIDGCPLPLGELTAEITIVGEENIGLEPVIVHFSLRENGGVEVKQR